MRIRHIDKDLPNQNKRTADGFNVYISSKEFHIGNRILDVFKRLHIRPMKPAATETQTLAADIPSNR